MLCEFCISGVEERRRGWERGVDGGEERAVEVEGGLECLGYGDSMRI